MCLMSGGPLGPAAASAVQQPLLLEIGLFLAEEPTEILGLCSVSTQFHELKMGPTADYLWRELYRTRWPKFFDCMTYQEVRDWRLLYIDTLSGRRGCTLEVFHRHKKVGFAMSAMPASVTYDACQDCYVARYFSASEVPPETIPAREDHRLRFCPEAVRPSLLEPRSLPSAWSKAAVLCDTYPDKVLAGIDGLRAGSSIELQWKMQHDSPFGWWYGHLEQLEPIDGGLAKAVITFRHFSPFSQWYRLAVVFGDDQKRECEFGGYTGGIRALSVAESLHFLRFFPKEQLLL
ncbi:unnamed protein product [Prorocentrum cordatum]|uniref:F-box domain-containing protein n=1 Tax=Prorocentrum cordatum TaxID=2364126 RepID=A0ABN9S469_9DINO|nr:unnamed protein product [Polarella glacialis]|mmetsp:Transcript_109267/g.296297  ORF Transcript_109267/g.296297 Transcript_109267/m.296297 type:complete len:290 (+) Transcript_109267:84-953(+)